MYHVHRLHLANMFYPLVGVWIHLLPPNSFFRLFLSLHSKQMGPPFELRFCSMFLPVKREFFLAFVTFVLGLGGSASRFCKVSRDNFNLVTDAVSIKMNWIVSPWDWVSMSRQVHRIDCLAKSAESEYEGRSRGIIWQHDKYWVRIWGLVEGYYMKASQMRHQHTGQVYSQANQTPRTHPVSSQISPESNEQLLGMPVKKPFPPETN